METIIVQPCGGDPRLFRITDFGDIFVGPVFTDAEDSYHYHVSYSFGGANIRGRMPIPCYATPFLDKFLITTTPHPDGVVLLYKFITEDERKCEQPHVDRYNNIVYFNGVVCPLVFDMSELRVGEFCFVGDNLFGRHHEICLEEVVKKYTFVTLAVEQSSTATYRD